MARKTNSQLFSSSNYIYNYYNYSICSKDSLIDLKTYHLGKLSAVLLIIKIDNKNRSNPRALQMSIFWCTQLRRLQKTQVYICVQTLCF